MNELTPGVLPSSRLQMSGLRGGPKYVNREVGRVSFQTWRVTLSRGISGRAEGKEAWREAAHWQGAGTCPHLLALKATEHLPRAPEFPRWGLQGRGAGTLAFGQCGFYAE